MKKIRSTNLMIISYRLFTSVFYLINKLVNAIMRMYNRNTKKVENLEMRQFPLNLISELFEKLFVVSCISSSNSPACPLH